MTRRRRAALAAALLVVTLAGVGARGGGAVAAPRGGDRADEPRDRLGLLEQPAWVPVGGDTVLRLRIDPPVPAGAEISLVARPALTSRSAFQRSLGGSQSGTVLSQLTVPLELVPPEPSGGRRLVVGLQSPALPRDRNRLGVRRPGVYPFDVELRDADDRRLGGFTTYLVVVDPAAAAARAARRLAVAWVWTLRTAPIVRGDGRTDPAAVSELEPDGRVGQQATALPRADGVPLTIVASPEMVEAWAALADTDPGLAPGAAALRDASPANQVLGGTYVPTELSSLLDAGLPSAVDAELVQGDDALAAFFGARADQRTALVRAPDEASLARLRTAGIDRVIIEATALAAGTARTPPVRPFLLPVSTALAPDATVSAVASDTALELLLLGDDDPALRAQRLLAGLSVIALEQPDATRGVTVVTPDAFDGSPVTVTALLDGLRDNPLLQPSTVGGVFDTVPREAAGGGPVVRELAPFDPPEPPVSSAAFTSTEQRLGSLVTILPPGDPRPEQAQQSLLRSLAAAYQAPGGRPLARGQLLGANRVVDTVVGAIDVPDPGTITLTSKSGDIPLTFRNATGGAVRIRVALESTKLFFPDGSVRDVDLPPRSSTVRFAVRARTSGTFPLTLRVSSVDGGIAIADERFRVRSTVVSRVGLVLTARAGVFLAAWWVFDLRRRRRRAGSTA